MNANAATPAKLAFLTSPTPGVYQLNLRVEGEDFYRLEISKGQLDNLVMDGARIALRADTRTLTGADKCNSAT